MFCNSQFSSCKNLNGFKLYLQLGRFPPTQTHTDFREEELTLYCSTVRSCKANGQPI